MSRHKGVYAWYQILQERFCHLSVPQVRVLTKWCFGMVLARTCGLTAVAVMLSGILKEREGTVRQCLREWYLGANDKSGEHRRQLDVETCFAPLLNWILSLWSGTKLSLALDATTLKSRFAVLAISVLYRGCAIPVAWTVLPANQKGGWRRHWLRMLSLLRPVVSSEMQVLVFADRGLYAPWLFAHICELGWHPMLRVNAEGTFCPSSSKEHLPFCHFCSQPGQSWRGTGVAFKHSRSLLACTLLASWSREAEEPWFILTDLPPEMAQADWYSQRAWIERGFKVLKREGWQWHRTRMDDPERAARLWLVLAVGTLLNICVGTEELENREEPESGLRNCWGFRFLPLSLLLATGRHVFVAGG